MKRRKVPAYRECPSCGSAAVTHHAKFDECGRCGHRARSMRPRAYDPLDYDGRLVLGGQVQHTNRDD